MSARRLSTRAIYITSFDEGLGYMKAKDQRSPAKVLKVLDKAKRFSVFEATERPAIANTMDYLVKEKLIEVDNSPGYPWSNVTLTAKGRAYKGF